MSNLGQSIVEGVTFLMIPLTQSSILISDVLWVKCGDDRVVKYGSMHGLPQYTRKACGYQFMKNTAYDY
jgi:hypothetical protein